MNLSSELTFQEKAHGDTLTDDLGLRLPPPPLVPSPPRPPSPTLRTTPYVDRGKTQCVRDSRLDPYVREARGILAREEIASSLRPPSTALPPLPSLHCPPSIVLPPLSSLPYLSSPILALLPCPAGQQRSQPRFIAGGRKRRIKPDMKPIYVLLVVFSRVTWAVDYRVEEKRILDEILKPEKYDSRIRPLGINQTELEWQRGRRVQVSSASLGLSQLSGLSN
ncbi:unnamed protein product [Darwinula stevensoni]|uniref:Uncharacterized protein n=1 Tax=Darwinula stevensoni TaxID=69355 RepID=A0A7R8X7W8_9CRUS|nr:unnamed protein product [Darwinula stevensoni]CAG0889526.1 unnamed protein product [Darwinula stevensoni]